MKKQKLYPSCSETVSRLGIEKEELPYLKKRVKELIADEEEAKVFFEEEVVDWVGKSDENGSWISEGGNKEIYEKIRDELLAKRNKICPICDESLKDLPNLQKENHFKEFHREELKVILSDINKEEYLKLKKEIVIDNL